MSKISIYEVVPVPKLADRLIGTSVGGQIEDVTYNFTLSELLNLFIPNIPANGLQGVLDIGNTATQDIDLFGTITTTYLDVTDTANLFITYLNQETHIVGSVYDSLNLIGAAGAVLTSTGSGVQWVTLPPIFTPNLQQVLTVGNTANLDIILSANIVALDINTDTETVNNNITIDGTITDGYSSLGPVNQVLSSTGTKVKWVNLPVYSATSPLLFNSVTGVFSIQQAGSTQNGYLSSSDWITFDGKQNAGNYITALTGQATANGPGSASIILNNSSVIAKVLTGLNITGGSISAADSILTAFGKVQNQLNGLVGGVFFKGSWNALINNPTLTSSVGTQGWYYIVSVAGNTNLNGITDWQVGDWAIFNGTTWDKIDNTDSVTSVNGFIGAVNLTTDNIPEGATNLYYLDSRARTAISLTTIGTSGAATYNNTTGVFNIPAYVGGVISFNGRTGVVVPTEGDYTLTELGDVTITAPITGQVLKYNGAIWINDTDANTGTVTSVSFTLGSSGTDLNSSVTNSTTTPLITLNVPTASASSRGALSSTDWSTFNSKQATISLTTTGTSGAATFISNTLNIPQYQASGTYVTSVTGTSPIVSSGGTTPAISIPAATGSVDGYLTSTDWTTFNNKANALSGTLNTVPKFTSASTIGDSNVKDNGNVVTVSATAGSFGALQVGNFNGSILMNTTSASGGLIFQNTSSSNKLWDFSSFGDDINFNESLVAYPVMTLKAGGNIGIKQTNPSHRLDIDGTFRTTGIATFGSTLSNGTFTYTLPSATGTLALISDIPSLVGYVPYTGATTNLNLGAFNLTSTDITANGNTTLLGTLTGTKTVSSGTPYNLTVTQNDTNGGDTGDGAISISHVLSGIGVGTELVTRSFIIGSNNSRTGGSVLSNSRVLYLVSSTQAGTTTTNLDQVYIEGGTMVGSVTNNRGVLVKTMQGTNQAAFVATGLTSANRVHLLLGNYTLPTGAWSIYSGTSEASYFQGNLLLGSAVNDGTNQLQVTGSSKMTGNVFITNKLLLGTAVDTIGLTTGDIGLDNDGLRTGAIRSRNAADTAYLKILYVDGSDNIQVGSSGNGLQIASSTGVSTFSSSVNIPSVLGLILGKTAVADGIISSASGSVPLRLKIAANDALVLNTTGTATFTSSGGFGSAPMSTARLTITDGTSIAAYWKATNLNAATRDWAIITNNANFGDFAIRQGNSVGADATIGTDRLLFSPTGGATFGTTLQVGGVLTLSSTISNGTFTYTLPSATGTLALVGGAGVGTVTSVAALTLGTTGVDLSSTVATGTTTPVITLNVPTASAVNRGALSSADWTTFNNKANALSGTINTIPKFTAASIIGDSNIKDNGSAVTINATAGAFGALQVGSFNGCILMNTTNASAGLIFQNTSSSNKLWDFTSSNNDLVINESNVANRMYFKAGGNIGINQTNPSFLLDVNGTFNATGVATFSSTVTSSGGGFVIAPSGTFKVVTDANVTLGYLIRSGTWKANAENSLSLAAETGFGISFFTGGSATERFIIDDSGKATFSRSLAVGAISPSGTVGRIDASNDIVAFSASDQRLKENIIPITNAIDKINKIGGYTFDWKSDKDLVLLHGFTGNDVGVIAQQIAEVLPQVVTTRDSGYMAVKYEKLIPLLIEAIKEQQTQIEELKTTVNGFTK